MAINTQLQQGTLNRLLTQLTLSSYPALNVVSGNFSKSFMRATLEGPFTTQIETATGVVNSPEPYCMASFDFGILRTQATAGAWISQVQVGTVIGTAIGYGDSSVFPSIQLVNCSVQALDPGGWDGMDPTIAITLRGLFYLNSGSWV
jgi:hypothetical protein